MSSCSPSPRPSTSTNGGACCDHDHSHDHSHPPPTHNHSHDHHHDPSGHCCSSADFVASFALPQDAPISTLSSTTTTASGSTGASATSTINSNNVVMTKVVCGGICCAREVPIILEIMAKVPGVVKTSVNVPMKKVLIEHDLGTVSVSELTKTLNKEGFEVKKLETQQPTNTNTTTAAQAKSKNSTAGRSIFSIPQVSNETDVEIIKSLLAPLEGVLDVVSGAVAEGSDAPFLVQVDHELDKISAKTICEELNDLAFDATIQQDAFYTEQKNAAGELLGMEMENGNGRYMNIPSKVKSTIEVVASGEEKKESADENGHSHAHAHAGKVDGDSSSLLSLVKEHLRLIFVEDLRPFLSQTETDSLLESIRTNEKGHNTVQITIEHSPLPMPLRRIISGLEARSQGTYQIKSIEDGADDVAWNFPTLDNGNNKTNQDSDQDSHDHSGDDSPVLPKLPVTLSGVLWVVSYLSFFGGSWAVLKYLAILSVAFGLPGVAKKAYISMRRFNFDTNCLIAFAAIGAIGLGDYQEAAAVTFLFAISDYLEAVATSRARNALSALIHLRPEYAWLVHPKTKQHLLVHASIVPVGAHVSVKTGDKVPCDGIVIEGESTVNESSLTGESRPVKKVPKDRVSGGTINCGMSHLLVQTTTTADNSAVARLIQLVEEAQANTSQTEKIVDAFAKIYTPVVVISGLLMCTIPWCFGPEIGALWTQSGLVFLVVGCPCALVISTPVTYVAGLAATAQRGIVIKGGAHLETLGHVKSICFDKTGTLTQGSYALLQLEVIGDKFSRKEMFEYLMLMEERANHPLGLALLDGGRNEGVSLPKGKVVKNHTFLAGEGLYGEIDGLKVHVGNKRLFKRIGGLDDLLSSEEMDNMVYNWERMAGTVGFMSIEGSGIVCAFCVADLVREESMQVVDELQQKEGISVFMLTGDSRDAANAIANIVGIQNIEECVKSELTPEDKLTIVSSMKDQGRAGKESAVSCFSNPFKSDIHRVMMVGDGVNDAPALAMADVGVAMGVGAALAMETADVTLLDSNLHKLLFSVKMGRRVLWKIRENVVFSLLVKVLMLGLAVFDHVPLWAAIVSDVGSMLCVTLNGMLLLPSQKIDRDEMGNVGDVSFHSRSGDPNEDDNLLDEDAGAYGTFLKGESAKLLH